MAPSAVETQASETVPIQVKGSGRAPLKASGILDQFEQEDVTPIIGTEFPKANLAEWINAPNADELLRDLAIKISERGVVFFRAQDDLTEALQKTLVQRLGELTGKPASSGLHIHPIFNAERERGGSDMEVSTINSVLFQQLHITSGKLDRGVDEGPSRITKKQGSAQWHSDIPFEPVPADYTSLRLVQLPKTGGDTLWASGYELYDRLSPTYQRFLSGLTATFATPFFNAVAAQEGFAMYTGPRGSPENVGSELKAHHPVVRTNPVTGWRSLFPVGGHARAIDGLTEAESRLLLDWFVKLIYENHDLQVRFRWRNKNDIAIWDNRSVFHTATYDLEGQGERSGVRTVGVGERPYFDPASVSRREALGQNVEVI